MDLIKIHCRDVNWIEMSQFHTKGAGFVINGGKPSDSITREIMNIL
jgi:hypothetical protein